MREEPALACVGMLPATECRTRMMALTRAGWVLISLQSRKGRGGERISRRGTRVKPTHSTGGAIGSICPEAGSNLTRVLFGLAYEPLPFIANASALRRRTKVTSPRHSHKHAHPLHNNTTFAMGQVMVCSKQNRITYTSSMFGSVNCTKRSLSWSTPARVGAALSEM